MSDLLLELGTEELPASFVLRAYGDLRANLEQALSEAQIPAESGVAMGTPRRLIVSLSGIPDRQPDQSKQQRGPSIKAAYDASGKPTPALEGFCRAQGVSLDSLRNDGEYVWVSKHITGRPTLELLSEIVPKAIRSLTFDKTMRWGNSRMRFARPIRWIVSTFAGELVPFDIEGVESGILSRGHRFYAPDPFEARTFAELVRSLRERKVEPDPEARRQRIIADSNKVAGGVPEMSEELVEENVFLTEWPTAVSGSIRDEYRSLPESVIVTAMSKHERMFPVRDSGGKLIPRFVFIRNAGEDETVVQGAEWVLNARFNDAKFFYDEDRRFSLHDFLEKTAGILFQDKLGSVRQRADRLAALSAFLASQIGASVTEAEQAGLYSKADLATGLVSELSSLQGVIGSEYARREGMPDSVCDAIASQYSSGRGSGPITFCLVVADQIDKLAGFLGLGLAATGSSDPFALRRACTTLIEAAWAWNSPLEPFDAALAKAYELYAAQGVDLDSSKGTATLYEALSSRYEALLTGVRYDIVDAALLSRTGNDVMQPRLVALRARALEIGARDTAFVQTATRPLNIISASRKKGIEVPSVDLANGIEGLNSEDAGALLHAAQQAEGRIAAAMQSEDHEALIRHLRELSSPISKFFDSTLVMDEDSAVRSARLGLVGAVARQLATAGDWSKIVSEA